MKMNIYSCSSLALLGIVAGCTSGGGMKKTPEGNSPKRPNVLVILADDQRADALGCSGNPYIKTPNIDSLADTGLRFTNAYIMGGHHGAISAPSRAMLMSGLYLFNVYDKLEGVNTMPAHFGKEAYVTFGTGKWHNGAGTFEASFQNGKDVFLGGMSDHFNVPCRELSAEGKLSDPVKKGFSTDVFSEAAIDFLEEYGEGSMDKPFFCYIAFTAPHDPYSPKEEYIDLYDDQSIPLPGNYMPLHPFQFDNLTVRDENLLPWPRPAEMLRSALSDYYALITHLDEKVGDIVTTLRRMGLYENTIIVYAADNGLAIGSHGLLGKQNLYEHSMKVPLIIRGPGIPEGKVSDAFVYLPDLFPTLSELCKVTAPENINGKSLVPLIRGNADKVRTSVFTAYRNTVRAVRTEEWKLIKYPLRGYSQLFNLKTDPLELNNLATDKAYGEILLDMENLLREWQTETSDTCQLTPAKTLPLEYDHKQLKRKPDSHQPEYTIKKYFGF